MNNPDQNAYLLLRNLALSFVAGNATLWKPAPSTPLCSVAITHIIADVLERNGIDGAVAGLITGDHHIGDALCESKHVTMGRLRLHSCTFSPKNFQFHLREVSMLAPRLHGRYKVDSARPY